MVLSKWLIVLVALLVVGCGSTLGTYDSSALGRPPQGPPNMSLTFLARSVPHEEHVIAERILLTEGSREGRLAIKTSTAASLSKGSRLDNPFPTVFFPWDSWEINPEVRDRLKATAHLMKCFPNHGLRIEGHTDVRGTESYNLVLGAKRAHAVKEYLSHLGIPAQRLETISYGKEMMVCEFDDESTCHEYNRRAELWLEQRKFLINTQARRCVVFLNFKLRWSDAPEGEARELALLPTLSGREVSLTYKS